MIPDHNTQRNTSPTAAKLMRVLLIEDSRLLRETIIEALSEYPNIVIEDWAATSVDAIGLLAQKKYDLMIADIELAQGNGFDVIQFNQRHELQIHQSPTKYLILTNHDNSFYRKTARELGVHYFYDKSMDFEQAIEAILKEAGCI